MIQCVFTADGEKRNRIIYCLIGHIETKLIGLEALLTHEGYEKAADGFHCAPGYVGVAQASSRQNQMQNFFQNAFSILLLSFTKVQVFSRFFHVFLRHF